MKLVVGLGNPGSEYQDTRHNAGFSLLDEVARQSGLFFSEETDKRSRIGLQTVTCKIRKTISGDDPVVLVKPLTYMNASGSGVAAVMNDLTVSIEDLLVVCDDTNLPLGRIRIRPGGSSGGQKGIEDIIRVTGTDQFTRLRIGIGPVRGNLSDFVLKPFDGNENKVLEEVWSRAAEAVLVWCREGTQSAMNRFNAAPDSGDSEKKKDEE